MEERLQKLLSRYGVASRRQAEAMIQDGRIRVNGNTAHLGDVVDEQQDVIEMDGVRLKKMPSKVYIMLNQPRGYVTTMHDEQGRKHVATLVQNCGERVYPVGRLDQYSEGLLLLTNDGDLANKLMHPSSNTIKRYHVWVSRFYPEAVKKMSESILINGRMTKAAKIKVLHANDGLAMLEVELSEGRNRQIRRLCEHADITVTRLKRIQEGPLKLGDLASGTWRTLSEEEIRKIKQG